MFKKIAIRMRPPPTGSSGGISKIDMHHRSYPGFVAINGYISNSNIFDGINGHV
jgi:hypothetical protein